eukprot:CAMPEP_0176208088 /NCGR_PEP_ID=MMETSP0121_2-20121125/12942_1 /TAXON_ID=160619 /ORGANISM="Kryptoperidinium foliaceum, Strain CCMP 1326" /LENGTH=532 /DNA_ID=CAMNT_0017547067 /DNA_START=33 /DNA_END=1630 /DNA_ORIENTATION=+
MPRSQQSAEPLEPRCALRREPLGLALALDHGDRLELDRHLGDVSVVARLDDLRHVLVALRGLLHDQLGRRHTDGDAHVLQALQHVAVVQVVPRLVPAQGSPGAVAGAAEGVPHALVGARKHVGAGAHRAAHDDGLAGELVVDRDQRVVRREGAGGTFSVDKQLLALAVNHVLLDLGDVVGHVVDHVHVEVLGRLVEHLREGLPRQEGHGGAVHPSVVCGGGHALHVVVAFRGVDARTCQLPVVRPDVVARHGALHLHQGIRGDLVAEASAAGVDHDADLALLVHAHLLRHEGVVDLVDDLDLRVVIPGAQSPELRQAALLGTAGNLVGVRVEHAPVLLAMLLVLRPSVAFPQRPVDAQLQRLLEVLLPRGDDALGADAYGDVVEEGLRQPLLDRQHVGQEEVRPHQPHAAIDVEADAARRHHGLRVAHVKRRYVPDREAVAAMHVGEADGVLHDARQRSHVADLLDRGEETADVGGLPGETSQLVEDEALEGLVDVELPWDIHAGHEPLLDLKHVDDSRLQKPISSLNDRFE